MPIIQHRPISRLDLETRTDEFLDFRLDVEQAADCSREPRRAFCLAAQKTGKSQFCRVGHTVEIMVWLRAKPDRGPDIGDEPIFVGAIMLDDRARVSPSAKEQLDETMVEDVEKAWERIVLRQCI